jgi:hypothetical protein
MAVQAGSVVPASDLPESELPAAPVPLTDLPQSELTNEFASRVGRPPEGPAELQMFTQHPETFPRASYPNSGATGTDVAVGAAGALANIGAQAIAGGAYGIRKLGEGLALGVGASPSAITADSTRASQMYSDINNALMDEFYSYMPGGGTPAARRLVGEFGEAGADVGSLGALPLARTVTNQIPNENIRQAVQEVGQSGGQVLSAAPLLGVGRFAGALADVGGRVAGRVAGTGEAAAASAGAVDHPTPTPTNAVTAEKLTAATNPIPKPNADAATAPSTLAVQKPHITPRAGESAQAAAARQGVLPATPEPNAAPASALEGAPAVSATPPPPDAASTPSGRLFAPPQEDGPQYAVKADDASKAARQQTLDDLNQVGGGIMKNYRSGAVSGDWYQTGNEHETQKLPGDAGTLMRDQIASEHATLENASNQVAKSVGSVARNDVDRDTLEQRGDVVRGAIHAIDDHFTGVANGLYATARATLGDRPMAGLPRVQQILSDPSHDVNPTAGALRRAATAKLQQLWTSGDTRGNVHTAPGTVGAAERFHEFLNDAYHNESASLIRKLKNATDQDVAERAGGNDMFQAARNVIQHREMMLEPDGVNELRRPRDRNQIDHDVPLHEVMDHVLNQDSEHFDHTMNVLRASAHLSPELAEKSAAAIREIQGHAIARLHVASRGEAGQWNASNFYKTANRFSTNLPSLFRENPEVLSRLQTINRGGNILKMDKSYPGAVAQAAKLGLIPSLVTKGAKAAGVLGIGGGAHVGGPVGAFVGHVMGEGLKKGAEGLAERSRVATARESLVPAGQRTKQGGWIGEQRQRDEIEHDQGALSAGTIEHSYRVPNDSGSLRVTETPALAKRQVTESYVNSGIRGKGWGTRMLQRAVDDAHAAGQVLHSDKQVSEGQAGAYKNLATLGYKVTKRDADLTGGAYHAAGDHVFEVRPQRVANSQRGSVRITNSKGENPYDTSQPRPDIWTGVRPVNDRMRQTESRTGNPYESGGGQTLGGRIFGGKQRGAVGDLTREYQAPKELEDFIKKQAPPHVVDHNGPTNWEELQARGHESPLPINPQSAEGSIYSDVPTNIAFRAWHDGTHVALNAGFDHDGELRVALEHQRQAKEGGLSEAARRALWADTWETFKHHEDTGAFPSKPREFVAQQMAKRFPSQRGSVKVTNESEPDARLNVGLHVADPNAGGRVMSPNEAVAAIRATGRSVGRTSIVNSDTEPTLVADLDRAMSPDELHALSVKLHQGAIPQRYSDGSGIMEGQNAKGWGEYNPDSFRMHDGRTATEHAATAIHPNSTVTNPKRSAFPGIYDDPKDIMSRVKTTPEDPILHELFGVHRKDLHDAAISRGDVAPQSIPGAKEGGKARGSKVARDVITPENATRLQNTIAAFKNHDESAYHGMVGWYVMDPLHAAVENELGKGKTADAAYSRLNTLMGMASPGSNVPHEISRGTAANMMAEQGKFSKFEKYGGNSNTKSARKNAPELQAVPGHPYHSTAQGQPMRRYLDTGVGAQAPKTAMYIAASEHPSSPGFQNKVLVGDSHFSRGVGLSDVRTTKDYMGSINGPEVASLHRWYHENVAKPSGLPSTSAQAVQWGALSHETGVYTPVGAPKLELFAQQVRKAAARLGVSPQEALSMIIKGIAHAG